ncbi:MAG: type IV pilus modification protein PilV [Gammaproteobacteria bacterium]|nr:type IV pilus modification protein PilV [Gammaproteobacteria bacterium]MCP4979323.1 type IV pilus modification protein PilV [Gammaproteobacteria bacterium]
MLTQTLNSRKNAQRGVTLVEAMIALLVISIGLLGIASLQITAMNQNTSSLNHSQAVWAAYNMSDRIRANISEFANYDGVRTDGGYSQDCMGGNCSADQMRLADATDWTTMVGNLPGGLGVISSNLDGLQVTVMWDDNGTGATGEGCDPTNASDLTCYTLAVAQ